jgi:hypothetical protein
VNIEATYRLQTVFMNGSYTKADDRALVGPSLPRVRLTVKGFTLPDEMAAG